MSVEGAFSRFLDDLENSLIDGTQQSKTKETIPTDDTKNNEIYAYSYDGNGRLQYIDQTINSTTYRKTLTYDGNGRLSTISAWIAQ